MKTKQEIEKRIKELQSAKENMEPILERFDRVVFKKQDKKNLVNLINTQIEISQHIKHLKWVLEA